MSHHIFAASKLVITANKPRNRLKNMRNRAILIGKRHIASMKTVDLCVNLPKWCVKVVKFGWKVVD